jgi:hypothetical protein
METTTTTWEVEETTWEATTTTTLAMGTMAGTTVGMETALARH